MDGKRFLELMRTVRECRLLIAMTESMSVADYLGLWQTIKDAYDDAKTAGMYGIADQISALHRAMLTINLNYDLECEEA